MIRRIKLPVLLGALAVAALSALACFPGELTPQGNWSGFVASDTHVYGVTDSGRLIRFYAAAPADDDDIRAGDLDSNWTYPSSRSAGVGFVYGPLAYNDADGVLYYASYTCSAGGGFLGGGGSASNCATNVGALDVTGDRDAREEWISSNYTTRVTGGVAVYRDVVLFAAANELETNSGDTLDGALIALDRANGEQLWRLTLDGVVNGPIEVDGNIAYFGTSAGTLYAVDLSGREGEVAWQYDAGVNISTRPRVLDGNVIFGTLGSGTLYSLNMEWRARASTPPDAELNPDSGEWSYEANDWIVGSPIVSEDDGAIYFSALNGEVYALSADDGEPIWDVPSELDGEIVTELLRLTDEAGGNVTLAVGLYNGTEVLTLDAEDGEIQNRSYVTSSGVSAPLFITDDVLYVQTRSGQLQSFNLGTRALIGCGQYVSNDSIVNLTNCR